MLFLRASLALALLQTAVAHTVFTTLFINGVNQGDGSCIRMNNTPDNCTSPVINLSSSDMACGFDGNIGVARVCLVPEGSKLTFLWREWADASQPGSIDSSHKGPCAVYMKSVASAVADSGHGAGWFKIWESGYNTDTSQWCTEELIKNNGLLSIQVPDNLAGGYYLVRPELLALHEADKSPPNPQFYTGCAQIFLESSGTAVPADTVSIPGYVRAGDPSVIFNIYSPSWPYPMSGPALYKDTSGTKAISKVAASTKVQTEGLLPDGCVLQNANWCGIELDSYDTETGCWNASTACFNQDTTCYSSSPPTGSKNCAIWEAKCNAIQSACNAGNFNGPSDKGKKLNPKSTTTYIIPNAYSMLETSNIPQASSVSGADFSLLTISKTHSADLLSATSVSTNYESVSTFAFETDSATFLVTDGYHSSTPDVAATTSLTTKALSDSPMSKTTMMALATSSQTEASLATSSSITSTTSSSEPSNATAVSQDATCGSIIKLTCHGSNFGSCCSQYGWCGTTDAYCGDGCQVGYGTCGKGVGYMGKGGASKHLHRHRHAAT